MSLFEHIEAILPISAPEWEQVEHRHHSRYPDRARTGDQLRKKFNSLAKTAIPTGDPNIPPDVREAKRIRELIFQKSDGGTGSPSEAFGLNLGPEDDDDAEVASINQGDQGAVPGVLFGGGVGAGLFAGDVGDGGFQVGAGGGVGNRPRSRSANTTPITNRRPHRSNGDGPSFNQVFVMMMRQQQMDRRDELERQRRADAQVQMQNTMMQTMMMAMLANSGVPMGGVMQSLNAIQAAGSFQAAAGEGEGARTTARERNETRQREREEERDQAWLQREESIQAALNADPNITRAELERMLDEEDRVRDEN